MNKMNFTPFPNLTTKRLALRQVKAEDENEMYILKSDKRIIKYVGYEAKTFEESRQYIHRINGDITKNECILWGIALKNKDKLIGTICFWNISEEDSRAEIGYELMPEYQGKGIMQEAAGAVIKYGFENMKLHSITAFPNPSNLKSVKLLERNNFIKGASFENEACFEQVTYTLTDKDIKS
jgi:[ribosomal protein S5]-alanine N-acetyltransferase